MRSSAVLVGERALKARLASFPADHHAVWRDDPPKYALKYPPYQTRDAIIAFAKQHGVQIDVLPTIYD
jgi:hypothetical protein